MATAVEPRLAIGRRLMTAADVAALPSQLPSGPANYELLQGNLLMMSPAGRIHGIIQTRIAHALTTQGDLKGLGITGSDTGVILGRNPDTLLAPDVLFVAARVQPERLSKEGWLETIPQLVVEVRSKNDSQPEMIDKAEIYLGAGVELVWIADPQRKVVTVHRKNAQPTEFGTAETLTAESIIPGFQLSLNDLFAD